MALRIPLLSKEETMFTPNAMIYAAL
jgi:hypothetical protein